MTAVPDPFAGLHDEGNGVPALRSALRNLRAGECAGALDDVRQARVAAVPSEAMPHAAVLEALALAALDRWEEGTVVAGDAWRAYPDFAALPATLGAIQRRSGHFEAAAQTLLASALSDDPDGSLSVWRPLLARLL